MIEGVFGVLSLRLYIVATDSYSIISNIPFKPLDDSMLLYLLMLLSLLLLLCSYIHVS